MPPPETVPPPNGEALVVRTYWMRVKLAVTFTGDVLALVATVQVPVPLQPPPDQPMNR